MWPHSIPIDHDLNKLEFTLPEDASNKSLAFLTKSFENKIFEKHQQISIILNYFPFERDLAVEGCFVPSFVEIGPVVVVKCLEQRQRFLYNIKRIILFIKKNACTSRCTKTEMNIFLN